MTHRQTLHHNIYIIIIIYQVNIALLLLFAIIIFAIVGLEFYAGALNKTCYDINNLREFLMTWICNLCSARSALKMCLYKWLKLIHILLLQIILMTVTMRMIMMMIMMMHMEVIFADLILTEVETGMPCAIGTAETTPVGSYVCQ